MGNDDPEALRRILAMGEPTGYGTIRPGDLPPTDFFMNFSDSPATSPSSWSSEQGGPEMMNRANGINGGINGAHIAGGDFSPILPMELMIYNDLMTDIGGTARVLGQEFQDSVLFGPTPTSSPIPVGQHPDQGPGLQPPSTVYGWVSSFGPIRSSQMLIIVIDSGSVHCMITSSARYLSMQHRGVWIEQGDSLPRGQD